MAHNKLFITSLQDAHAMEVELTKVLEAQCDQAKDYPEIKSKLVDHLEATKKHETIIKTILESLGEDVSAVKSGLSNLSGMAMGSSTGLGDESLLAMAKADYIAEHKEIMCYNVLIEMANELGHGEMIDQFTEILNDEEDMAQWIEDNVGAVVKIVFSQKELQD